MLEVESGTALEVESGTVLEVPVESGAALGRGGGVWDGGGRGI